ncbi:MULTISPECIES: DUF2127 domain-containing protein [Streptomycetaceae]|uniref:DUF2127 domain-containing protein n=1 Tax=Streptantibioticus cattleyicolor (strain ATCC 35852 / DSM 46488 / JCM 4925 / NBRC 14057 / NRRL 8057) TaxID=1003195 RepID=F8JQC0_STREN|nr:MULTISPECIES: DUF2127 domain-containing protein [Streptomycetaceae]AEW96583.1 hypothetical protein SCATT_42120 [Streptantibioticus cattleyicolor NRRL 8057 = DSM 46488]MYS61079.1 DUF2127 domain-containing protein [Streptomyces sp. SID5468]CCB76920.1 conserved protein of unknown function [Streptantibioticus cattleyicolor NRRL 8057 = DSM 46488]
MKLDWNRRTCARRGHVTYAPDEAHLRERLHAVTGLGDAWRCLRCGDFTVGAPHGTGPADRAPVVPRGRALRDLLILRFLAVERVVRGLFIVLAAVAVWKFSNSRTAVRQFFEQNLTVFRPVAAHFHYDLDHSPVVDTIRKTFDYKHSTLLVVAAALLAYALIEIVEGAGLWFARRWAEYLTVVATAAFLPLEVYELTEKVSGLKIATLALNVLAVLYILLAKRLFGLRGGARAFEAERRGDSLLEVETAAGAGAGARAAF